MKWWIGIAVIAYFVVLIGVCKLISKSNRRTKIGRFDQQSTKSCVALTKRCPNGHKSLLAALQNFCTQCGAMMVQVEIPCCACGERRFGGDDYCANCGARFMDSFQEV